MASQTLLNLVARLQQAMSVAQGRAMLLDYARKSCGARLALLFTLEPEGRVLALRDHSGRHPHPSSFTPETAPIEISPKGLFGSALRQIGFVDIPDITLNALSLPEERSLAWPHGRVLLHALRQGTRWGVLVFCFSPAGSRIVPSSQAEDELLICSSLLSAYMGEDEEFVPARRASGMPVRSPDQPERRTRTSKIKNIELQEAEQIILEKERARIAREMHDTIMQDVAHVAQKLDYIQRILEKQPQTALSELDQARALLDRSLRDLRSGISSLLPVPLKEQEFDEALKALLREYSLNLPHLKVTSNMDDLALWPRSLQAPIYRFMQEALNNIRKHASASAVNIRIRHFSGLGIVQISDNGRGFLPEQIRASLTTSKHLGLQTMEERIRQAGGTLEILSKPGEGTTLKARFSLTQSSAILTEREREVLRLLVEGLTNRAISEHLSVSLETVKSHVHHIMQKMHVKDRTQAAVIATRQQWL